VVHLNPYADFISGLNSSENQQFLLIVELFSLLWYINTPLVKICWWSLTFDFGLQYSAGLLIIVNGQAFSFGNTVWFVSQEEYPLRTQVAYHPEV
jgi:hypothetical protein